MLLLLAAMAAPLSAQKQHEMCGACHTERVKDFLTHPHFQKGIECDACHGESKAHRTSLGHTEPDKVAAPAEIPALCGGCHPGKEKTTIQAQYLASKHGRLVVENSKVRAPHCGTCHGVHDVRTGKAMERQCRRCHDRLPAACSAAPARQAALVCAACHNPHSLTLLAKAGIAKR
ncbi:MAG TPA: hypothetical protein VEU62_00395 [Bryobacterales bacterium]|nr:hypothetical protein [Bryobacterales bacterium]